MTLSYCRTLVSLSVELFLIDFYSFNIYVVQCVFVSLCVRLCVCVCMHVVYICVHVVLMHVYSCVTVSSEIKTIHLGGKVLKTDVFREVKQWDVLSWRWGIKIFQESSLR